MSKLQEIKAAQLAARKAKDTTTATLLTTLIGEAEMVGKSAGNRESTDEEILAVLKKFEKNINETIGYLKAKNVPDATLAQWLHELKIIKQYLPAKIDDADIQQDIANIMIENDLKYEQKSMGVISKELKQKYKDRFDGQQVSTIFKQLSTI